MSCRVSLHLGWQPQRGTRVGPNGCGLSATASLIRQEADRYAHDVLSIYFPPFPALTLSTVSRRALPCSSSHQAKASPKGRLGRICCVTTIPSTARTAAWAPCMAICRPRFKLSHDFGFFLACRAGTLSWPDQTTSSVTSGTGARDDPWARSVVAIVVGFSCRFSPPFPVRLWAVCMRITRYIQPY